MKTLRKLSTGSNKNRPGGRLHQPTILVNPRTGVLIGIKQATPPSQGRGETSRCKTCDARNSGNHKLFAGHEFVPSDYKPIANEPRMNTEVVREQLKAKTGIQMPTPETRQQRHERAKQTRKAEYREAVEAFKLAAINRPARENWRQK